jgi:phosphate starvation-inducible membrane PsiE
MKRKQYPLILAIVLFFILFNIVTLIVFYYIFQEEVNLNRPIII